LHKHTYNTAHLLQAKKH